MRSVILPSVILAETRATLALAVPLATANLSQMAMSDIDTVMVGKLGAVPLALAFGTGAELRRPLGISIIGGLVVSQVLTLYTTPVVYLALERWAGRRKAIVLPAAAE